ncbi:MAG: Toxin co-regulated pilus biosynthesis protein, partial [Rhodospirillales bacterium]|nr:Toxin co-regulated pilus biosynthesis protein [Rhodospirillales bacterium]
SGTEAVSAKAADASPVLPNSASQASAPWPVESSLKSTLGVWAQRQGWPAPHFLTEADWAVDVPGSIPGAIEDALKTLAEGFGKSPSPPRIEISANHVILVPEVGSQ